MKKVFIILCLMTTMILAQSEKKQDTIYTCVAVWGIDRASWPAFVKFAEENWKPVCEQLMKDKVLVEWGVDEFPFHNEKGMTHTYWWSYHKQGDQAKVDAAFEAFNKKRSDKENEASRLAFAAMVKKHHDWYLKSKHTRSVAADYKDGVFREFMVRVKLDHGKDFESYYHHRIKPVYKKLQDDGVLIAYGLSVEELTMGSPGYYSVWYIAKDQSGLDAVNDAFDADWGAMPSEDRRARWASIKDMVEMDTFREQMSNILMGGTQAIED